MEGLVYTNALAVTSWCKEIANTFTPDDFVVRRKLMESDIDPNAEYTEFNIDILKIALSLVNGHVKTLDIEGDVHQNTYWQGVRDNIIRISREYGLDPSIYISRTRVRDRSEMW